MYRTPKPRRRSTLSRSRLIAASMAAAAALVLGTAAAESASADTISFGCGASCPGLYDTVENTPGSVITGIGCSPGRISISSVATVQAGYYAGQWMTYRYWISDSQGNAAAYPWQAAQRLPYSGTAYGKAVNYAWGALPNTVVGARTMVTGTGWTVKVQYAWYSNTGWVYSNWADPTGGYTQNGGYAKIVSCYT